MKYRVEGIVSRVLALAVVPMVAFAGGLNTNTNQSVLFQRSVARDASTDVDAPYANPSGTAFMDDGLYISLNNQTFWQNRSVTVEKSPIFKDGEEFKGDAFVPFLSSALVTWHKGNFALSGHVGVIGGGGKVNFDDGIPSFFALTTSPLKQMEAGLTEKGLKTDASSVDISLEASSYIFGATVGAAYEFNKMFSVYAGARFNYAMNSYDGTVGNLQLNTTVPGVNPDGKMVEASVLAETFEALAEKAETKEEKVQYATLAETFKTMDDKMTMDLELDQTGWGITPIVGLGFQYKRLTVGAKFEYKTSIEMENDTKKNDTPLEQFNDGKKDHNDIPSLLAVGLNYALLDNVRLALGYHHWFDSKANFSGDLEDHVDDTNEFLYGVEVDFLKRFTISGGVQVTRFGIKDDYISDMNINISSTSFGFGLAYWATDWMRVNLSYFHTLYQDYDETVEYGVDVYERDSRGFGVGLDFKL